MKLKNATAATAIAAAGVLIAATAAHATTTVSVGGTTSPAGAVAVTAASVGTITFSTNFGVPASCTTGTATGTVNRGASAVAGTTVGAISNLTFSSCIFTQLYWSVNITKKATPATWPIVVKTTPTKGQRYVAVEVQNVSARMLANTAAPYACGVNATGTVPGRIDTQLDQLQIIPTAGVYPLTLDALDSAANKPNTATSSCGGEIQDGDLAQMTGTFQLNQDVAIS